MNAPQNLSDTIIVARILIERGPKLQITYNDVIRNFQKEKLFMGQRYRRMKDQKPGHGLVRNQDFAKGGGLERKNKKFPKNF